MPNKEEQMFGRLGAPEILLLVLVVVLLFGAARLPRLARSLREARDEFQKGSTEEDAPSGAPSNGKPAEATSEKPPDAT
ncbi:MAG TPA: twin-arginine translocase TatA/TatE family subunit [Actinomycetota bacterium]|nr:twin-arginine translocase TatA/TatE family subunit [Actinomycetota bacterium]